MTSLRAAYEQFQKRGGIAVLSERVEIILTGADRVRYLNGQVTSNVTKLATGQTQPACVTTAKGRLCAEILITAQADALHLDADPALRATLPARLERYIIADDVALTDITDTDPDRCHLFDLHCLTVSVWLVRRGLRRGVVVLIRGTRRHLVGWGSHLRSST